MITIYRPYETVQIECNVPALAIAGLAGASAGAALVRFGYPLLIHSASKLLGARGTAIGEEPVKVSELQVIGGTANDASLSNSSSFLAVVDPQTNTVRPLSTITRSLGALAYHDVKVAYETSVAAVNSQYSKVHAGATSTLTTTKDRLTALHCSIGAALRSLPQQAPAAAAVAAAAGPAAHKALSAATVVGAAAVTGVGASFEQLAAVCKSMGLPKLAEGCSNCQQHCKALAESKPVDSSGYSSLGYSSGYSSGKQDQPSLQLQQQQQGQQEAGDGLVEEIGGFGEDGDQPTAAAAANESGSSTHSSSARQVSKASKVASAAADGTDSTSDPSQLLLAAIGGVVLLGAAAASVAGLRGLLLLGSGGRRGRRSAADISAVLTAPVAVVEVIEVDGGAGDGIWGTVTSTLAGLQDTLGGLLGSVTSGITAGDASGDAAAATGGAGSAVSGALASVTDAAAAAWAQVVKIETALVDGAAGAWEGVSSGLQGLWGKVGQLGESVGSMLGGMRENFTGAWSQVVGAAGKVQEQAAAVGGKVQEGAKSAAGGK